MELNVNGRSYSVDVEGDTPLLWVLRESLGLTGTKYGCGIARCGACTVLVNDMAVRSCATPVQDVGSAKVTTIEGLGGPADQGAERRQPDVPRALHPVQQAWLQENVPQCGYCQPGQIMAAAALMKAMVAHTTTDRSGLSAAIDRAMAGNLCRCGTYPRIRAAIEKACAPLLRGGGAVTG
jgi:isoquinoline 1-oxidoreductase alpha subunit